MSHNKCVCHLCIGNKHLKEFVKKNGELETCDYCGHYCKSVSIEMLLEPILSGIAFEYDEAVNCLPCEKGEYIGKTIDNYDMLTSEICDDLDIDNEEILIDLSNEMEQTLWCEKDPFADKPYEEALFSWQQFCDLVKHHNRFSFFKNADSVNNPVSILEEIASYIEKAGLIRKCSENIYRGRVVNSGTTLTDVKEFGPPPVKYAVAGRMNPEGISMFYGAMDEDTVIAEIGNSAEEVLIARFTNKKKMNLINLSKLSTLKLPSIFDEKKRNQRTAILFLREFEKEISKPVNDDEKVEYVPTQIMTEYFRYVFKSKAYDKIDGVMYSSAKNPKGKCVVLFMDDKDFCNDLICPLRKDTMRITRYLREWQKV